MQVPSKLKKTLYIKLAFLTVTVHLVSTKINIRTLWDLNFPLNFAECISWEISIRLHENMFLVSLQEIKETTL